MKKYYQRFVDDYNAILALKRTHKKAIDYRSFVLESFLIVFCFVGFLLLIGWATGLNQQAIYINSGTFVILFVLYGFLVMLYEVRYQYKNKLEYKTGIVVLYQEVVLGFSIIIATGFAWLYEHTLFSQSFLGSGWVNATFWGYLLFLILPLAGLLFIGNRGIIRYVRTGILIALFYFVVSNILILNPPFGWLVGVFSVVVLWLIFRYNQLLKLPTYTRYAIAFVVTLSIGVLWYTRPNALYSTVLAFASNSFVLPRGEDVLKVEEARLSGSVGSGDRIYLSYLDANGSYVSIYDTDFTHIIDTEIIPGALTMYIENDVLYGMTYNGFYKILQDGSLEEIFVLDGADVLSVAFPYENEYYYITGFQNKAVYRITENGDVEEVLSSETVLLKTDNMKLSIENGIVEFYSSITRTSAESSVRVYPDFGENVNHPEYAVQNYYKGYELRYYNGIGYRLASPSNDILEEYNSLFDSEEFTLLMVADYTSNYRTFKVYDDTVYFQIENSVDYAKYQTYTELVVMNPYNGIRQYSEADQYVFNLDTVFVMYDDVLYSTTLTDTGFGTDVNKFMMGISFLTVLYLFDFKRKSLIGEEDHYE